MEIFKEEVGEIMLHDKRQYGKILGKICKKTEINCRINDINSFPKFEKIEKNNYLEYNENIEKLKFNYSKTEDCQEGCFLLITYYHKINYEKKDNIIIGYEFTLLERIWNYEDWHNTPIINIPNNEYIFGYFEKYSINHHYYSIFVSNETDKIIMQIKSNYIQGFYGEGKKRLNTYGIFNTEPLDIEEEMFYIDVEKFKNKYISFAFRSTNFFEKELAFYYFRIFQFKENDILIIPIDSNVVNVYNPIDFILYECFFLLKNEYNEFSLNYSIFNNQNEDYDIYYIEYPFQNISLDISYDNLNDLLYNEFFELRGPLKNFIKNNNNNNSYFLFHFDLYSYYTKNILNILSTFYQNESNIYPHIYSSEIYHLDYITNFYFFLPSNFSLTLKWINGEGQINNLNNFKKGDFELNKNFIGKPYSFSIENITNITCINKKLFSFYLELNYITERNVIRQIDINRPTSEIIKNKQFPIYYFFPYYFINDHLDINFKLLDFEYDLNNFIIEGMICEEDLINDLRQGNHINFKTDYKGQYDLCSKIGLLQFFESNNIYIYDSYTLIN